MKKPYQIVTRSAKVSAAVVEEFCESNGQILLPIIELIESASRWCKESSMKFKSRCWRRFSR